MRIQLPCRFGYFFRWWKGWWFKAALAYKGITAQKRAGGLGKHRYDTNVGVQPINDLRHTHNPDIRSTRWVQPFRVEDAAEDWDDALYTGLHLDHFYDPDDGTDPFVQKWGQSANLELRAEKLRRSVRSTNHRFAIRHFG